MFLDNYHCINCKGKLELVGRAAQCITCNAKYPHSEGVILFNQLDPQFMTGSPELDEKLDQLLILTKTIGYRNALKHFSENGYTNLFKYATDLTRVDFKYLLPLTSKSTILEIGPGHGLITVSLARNAKEVYCLEKIQEHALFTHLRAQQEGLNNVYVSCGGSKSVLPYRDNTFDIVVINGVFEWIGYETDHTGVEKLRKEMMKEIHRVTKENGTVYITTKNRYSLELNWRPNEHNCRIRCLFLLPDRLANALSSKIAGVQYLTKLLSLSQYRKLFENQGFTCEQIWVPLPNFRYPKEFLPFHNRHKCELNSHAVVDGGRLYNILSKLPWKLRRQLSYSHSFILAKNNPVRFPLSLINKINHQDPILTTSEVMSVICGGSPSLSSAIIVHVIKNKQRMICKIGRFKDLPFLKREIANVTSIEQLNLTTSSMLPKILSSGIVDGLDYCVLPYYRDMVPKSISLISRSVRRVVRNALLNQAKAFLIELGTMTRRTNDLSYRDNCESSILEFAEKSTNSGLRQLCDQHLKVLQDRWSEIAVVWMHGDFSIYNIIITEVMPLKCTIVDWESMDKCGFAGVDLHNICDSVQYNYSQIQSVLREYCKSLGICEKLVASCVFLQIIRNRGKWIKENDLVFTDGWVRKEQMTVNTLLRIRT